MNNLSMNDNSKNILFLCSASPQQGHLAREALDASFAFAAFEQQVSVLFSGEGIWQLVNKQQGSAISGKSIQQNWQAAELYDINGLYVSTEETKQLGILAEDLLPTATLLSNSDIAALMHQFDAIVSM